MPTDHEAQQLLSDAQQASKQGNFDTAVEAYQSAIRLAHDEASPQAMLELSELYIQADKPDMAQLWLKQLLLTGHGTHGPAGQELLDSLELKLTAKTTQPSTTNRPTASSRRQAKKTPTKMSKAGIPAWFSRNPTDENIEDLLASRLDNKTGEFRFPNQKESDLAVKMMRGFLMMSLARQPVIAKRVMSLLGALYEQRGELDEAERKYRQAFANGVDEAALKAGALIERSQGKLAARDFYAESKSQASSAEPKERLEQLEKHLSSTLETEPPG